uniref:Uncharacterized protein n=1 Tax=Cannabis sativa TaxID=3483 RepID=A0A803QCS0_CANSA
MEAVADEDSTQIRDCFDLDLSTEPKSQTKLDRAKFVEDDDNGQEKAFCITFIYGFNTLDERKSLWTDVLSLKLPMKPWILLHDFNDVFNLEDKTRGNPIQYSDLLDSSQCLAQAHVETLNKTSSTFTWTNYQDSFSRIYSKIDHAFVNDDWGNLFPNSTAHFGWEVISYHYSCVINAKAAVNIGVKPF